MKILIFIIVGLFISFDVFANNTNILPHIGCFEDAAKQYQIDKHLLLAIAKTESNFDTNALNINADGTEDYGLMQINSWWITSGKLKKIGVTKQDLVSDSCINIHVGAWVLSGNFNSHGVSWDSVGAYNAGFKKDYSHKMLRLKYAQKVYGHYSRLRKITENSLQAQ